MIQVTHNWKYDPKCEDMYCESGLLITQSSIDWVFPWKTHWCMPVHPRLAP